MARMRWEKQGQGAVPRRGAGNGDGFKNIFLKSSTNPRGKPCWSSQQLDIGASLGPPPALHVAWGSGPRPVPPSQNSWFLGGGMVPRAFLPITNLSVNRLPPAERNLPSSSSHCQQKPLSLDRSQGKKTILGWLPGFQEAVLPLCFQRGFLKLLKVSSCAEWSIFPLFLTFQGWKDLEVAFLYPAGLSKLQGR